MPDRTSGDYRFFQLLRLLAGRFDVRLSVHAVSGQQRLFGAAAVAEYLIQTRGIGVEVLSATPLEAVQAGNYDAVLFEFYTAARGLIEEVRFRCPAAVVVVDSVDVHFSRELLKARMTNNPADLAEALDIKAEELACYRAADLVIAVTAQDQERLHSELPAVRTAIIPNLHEVPAFSSAIGRVANQLLFVGGFRFRPNVDAALYFTSEILPLIRTVIPDARLVIAGESPPPEVLQLACDMVTVPGYVPDLAACYREASVSVAPLRYGGGMKGKVGEAMAHGLPVVTTSVGAEGFGFSLGRNVLVGDTAEAFAAAVISLLTNRPLYDQIRYAGWQFIRDHYSLDAVAAPVLSIFAGVADIPAQRLPLYMRIYKSIPISIRRRLWGMRRGRSEP